MDPSRTTTAASVDLERLRIRRAPGDVGRVRGFPLLGLLVLAALGGAGWLFRDELRGLFVKAAPPAARTAKVQRVTPAGSNDDVDANGYVIADRSASLASVLSGRLVELNAQEGDIVEKDAVVARIQYDDLEAQEKEAQARTRAVHAQVEQATRAVEAARMDVPRLEAERETLLRLVAESRENAERLDREVERNRALVPRAVSADALDRLQAQARAAHRALEAAEARVSATRAALDAWEGEIARRQAELGVAQANEQSARLAEASAAILVEKTRIRAPFRGLVVRKDAERGEVIAPTGGGANSRGSVLTIVDPESLEMQVELNERRISRVKEGDTASVRLDAEPAREWPAVVRKIWPRADRSKGTIEVRVRFLERPAYARPEMAGKVAFRGTREVAAPAERPVVTVPAAAVVQRGGQRVVFVVADGVARQRPVKTGEARGDALVVEEGLEGGETVVLSPDPGLADGSPFPGS